MANDLVALKEKMALAAQGYGQQEAAAASSGGGFLTIKGGILMFGEDALPGNQVAAIVLDSIAENTFYDGAYVPDNPQPPTCYAFGRSLEEMAPHPSMQSDLTYFKPMNHDCESCPMNVFGSAATGRGKACQNRRRLSLIPAGIYVPRKGSRDFDLHYVEDEKSLRTADIVSLKLPVTSVANWAKYVTTVAAEHSLPPHGVVTRISVEPHPKRQFEVKFELIATVPEHFWLAIDSRHEEARRTIIRGYVSPNQREDAPARQ